MSNSKPTWADCLGCWHGYAAHEKSDGGCIHCNCSAYRGAEEDASASATSPVPMQKSTWGELRRYPTDDRDLPKEQRHDLIIYPGPNGDWYVATDHEGARGMLSAVRLCTSGGASTSCPGLTNAIANAYRAMGGEVIETACPRPLPCVRLDQHHEDDCTPEPSAPTDGELARLREELEGAESTRGIIDTAKRAVLAAATLRAGIVKLEAEREHIRAGLAIIRDGADAFEAEEDAAERVDIARTIAKLARVALGDPSPITVAFSEVLSIEPVVVREGPFGAEIDALNAITDLVMKSGGSGSPREWLQKICSVGLRALAAGVAKVDDTKKEGG